MIVDLMLVFREIRIAANGLSPRDSHPAVDAWIEARAALAVALEKLNAAIRLQTDYRQERDRAQLAAERGTRKTAKDRP